jgi:hypothetical protein
MEKIHRDTTESRFRDLYRLHEPTSTREEILQLEREKQEIGKQFKMQLIVFEQTGQDLKTALGKFDCELDATASKHFKDFFGQISNHYSYTDIQNWTLLNAHVGRLGQDWIAQWKREPKEDMSAINCVRDLAEAHTPINYSITAKDEFRALKQGNKSLIELQQAFNRIKARI